MILDIIRDNIRTFPKTVVVARMMIKKQHMNSDLGWIWAILKPIMYVCMFYLAISFGFKSAKNIDGLVCPYFVWVATGIVAWYYMSDMIGQGPMCFKRNSALFSKSEFPVSAVPMIPVLSNLMIHLLVVGALFIMAIFFGARPSIYWLQLPVYMCISIFTAFLWAFASGMLYTLSADFNDLIKTIRPAFFWLSGILFNSRGRSNIIFDYNPITFIIEGYRNCMCFNKWIWEDKVALMHFGEVQLFMIVIILVLYRRMRYRLPEIV